MTLESLSRIGRETSNIGKYFDLEDQLIEEEDYMDIKYQINVPIEEQNKYFAMLDLLIRKLFKDVEMQSYVFLMPETTMVNVQQNNITCYNISLEILTNYNIEINQKVVQQTHNVENKIYSLVKEKNVVNQTNNFESKIYNLVKEKNVEKTNKSYNQIKQGQKEQKAYSQPEKVSYAKQTPNKIHQNLHTYLTAKKQENYQKAKNSYAKPSKKIEEKNYHHIPKTYAKAKKVEKNNYQPKTKTGVTPKTNYAKINKSDSLPTYQKQNLEKLSRTNPSYQRNNQIQKSPLYSRGQINNKPASNYQRNLSPSYSSSKNAYSKSMRGYSGKNSFSSPSRTPSYGMKAGKTAAKGSSK